jgi:MerR family regulatory protein
MVRDAEPTELKIGDVARLTGLPVRTIRYYERRGLLEPVARSDSSDVGALGSWALSHPALKVEIYSKPDRSLHT